MFRQRLLTALVLVPLVLLAIYYANAWILGLIVLSLVVIAGMEWLQLIPIHGLISKLFFIFILISMVFLSIHLFNYWLIVGLIVWIFILIAVVTFPATQIFWGHRSIVASMGLLLLPLFASTLAALYQHPEGKNLIVYLFCLVWATDIGAYLAGKQWGRHKLIPAVSPGKTVEGAIGGFLLSMLVAFVWSFYLHPQSVVNWYAVALLTTLIAMLGDLFISMLKRRSKLKDTGHILPGHGGILDRLDSLIAALPFFYYGLLS